MKSIKFLAALAIPAMFAACTNEEIATNSSQQMKEVVGAELVGTNISLNVGFADEAQSRMTANGSFTKTDVLGLGWMSTSGGATAEQKIDKAPENSTIWANHRFAVNEEGKFSTWSNVYKGWHFAYYPYEYMEQVGVKKIELNPAQTSKVWADRLSQNFHISARSFLTKDNLNADNSLNSNYVMYNTVSNLVVMTAPSANSEFVAGGELDSLSIKYIKITADENVFASKADIRGSQLPADTTVSENGAELLASFYQADESKSVIATGSYLEKEITTDVKEAGYKVSDNANLVTIVRPNTAELDTLQIKIEVGVAGGYFNIEYVNDAVAGSDAAKNNEAIVKLASVYAPLEAGVEATKSNTVTVPNTWPTFNVVLYGDIFHADFGNISTLEEWKDAVKLCEALGRTEQEFGIDAVINFNEGNIPMPEGCTIEVVAAAGATETGLAINKTLPSWPAGLTANVDVINNKTISDATGINGKTITNYGKMTLPSDSIKSKLINEGTITLKALAALTDVNNAEGRINVAYGSYITLTSGTESTPGIIAYTISATEKAYRINNLTGKTNDLDNEVNVNTLVIKSGRTLNLNLKDAAGAAGTDPYKPAPGSVAVPLADLSDINIEMNGGSIIVGEVEEGEPSNNKVNNISVLSGENTLTDVVPASVEVAEGAKLTVNTTSEDGTLDWASTAVLNNGEFTTVAKLHVASIENNGTITATGYYIHSAADPVLNDAGTVKGKVIQCDGTPEKLAELGEKLKAAIATYNVASAAYPEIQIYTYAKLISTLNSGSAAAAVTLQAAFTEYYNDTLITDSQPGSYVKSDITKIENTTGVEFGFTE